VCGFSASTTQHATSIDMRSTLLFLITALVLTSALKWRDHDEKNDIKSEFKKAHHGPKRWSAETYMYLGPAAGKCPYADSSFGGSVAFDYESKAARFDTLWNSKGAKPHTTWVFKDDDTINFYFLDRSSGSCKSFNKSTEEMHRASKDSKFEYKDSYNVGSQMINMFYFESNDYKLYLSLTAQGKLPTRAVGVKGHSLLYSVDYLSPHYNFPAFTFDLPSECQGAELEEADSAHQQIAEALLVNHSL